jgi:hypothetical protein
MLLPILTLITIFMVTACSSQRSALTDELATQTHTLPFALNESCELGSIIVLDPNGLPQCIAGKGTLLGKVHTVAAPKALPSTAFDRTAVLTASASANPFFSNSPQMKAGLKISNRSLLVSPSGLSTTSQRVLLPSTVGYPIPMKMCEKNACKSSEP